MDLRSHVSVLVPACAALLFVIIHFGSESGDADAAAARAPGAAAAESSGPSGPSGLELDEAKRQEWRESRRGSFLDSGEEREERAAGQTLSRYGMMPLEFAGMAAGEGVRVIASPDEVRKQIQEIQASGGHYAGPVRDLDLGAGGER